MNCAEAAPLLHAHADGELDAAHSAAIEEHLRTCESCAREHEKIVALRSAIGAAALRFAAPAALRERIRETLAQESPRAGSNVITPPTFVWRRWTWPAAIAAILLLSFALSRLWLSLAARDALAQEIVTAHVRALLTSHVADVISTDRHTVKPWFDGRLDFSPPVADLASDGFPLDGARLDYLAQRPVAALIYHRAKHPITLFVWPASASSNESLAAIRGYNMISWSQSAMTFAAVSDVNADDLRQFARLLRQQLSPPNHSG